MLIFADKGNVGKTAWARLNNGSTLLDFIKCNAYIGSIPATSDRVYHKDNHISCKANCPIPMSWLATSIGNCLKLDHGLKLTNFNDQRYEAYLIDLTSFLNDDSHYVSRGFTFQKAENIQRRLLAKEVPLTEDPNIFQLVYQIFHLSNKTNNNRDYLNLVDIKNFMNQNGQVEWSTHFPDENNISFIEYAFDGPDDDVVFRIMTHLGSGELFYYKLDNYYPYVGLNRTLSAIETTGHPTHVLVYKLLDGLGKDQPAYMVAGIGFPSFNVNTWCITFAVDQSLVQLDFSGMPYFTLAENGPLPPTGYYQINQTDINNASTWNIWRADDRVQSLATLSCDKDVQVMHYGHMFKVFDLSNFELISQERIAITRLLYSNRCIIDSISNLVYSSTGATMAGGLSSDVVSMIMGSQLNEQIAIYSPTDEASAITGKTTKSPDPLLEKVRDAHITGVLSIKKPKKDDIPREINFTTRNKGGRKIFYKLSDDEYVYGNRVKIKKAKDSIQKQVENYDNFTFAHEFEIDPNYDGYVADKKLDIQISIEDVSPRRVL